ncbi:MAG: hypothetical protein AB7G37_10190 [Solirubrobacteraceae bacterium]
MVPVPVRPTAEWLAVMAERMERELPRTVDAATLERHVSGLRGDRLAQRLPP